MQNEKVKQVIIAIKENPDNYKNDEELIELLSILNVKELDLLELEGFLELDPFMSSKITNLIPLHKKKKDDEVDKFHKSDIYNKHIISLQEKKYNEFISELSNEEIAKLKKYIAYNIDENNINHANVSKKIIRKLTDETKRRDEKNKHQLAS